jgi:hypothetical protein
MENGKKKHGSRASGTGTLGPLRDIHPKVHI